MQKTQRAPTCSRCSGGCKVSYMTRAKEPKAKREMQTFTLHPETVEMIDRLCELYDLSRGRIVDVAVDTLAQAHENGQTITMRLVPRSKR